jgi:hypothetical protein
MRAGYLLNHAQVPVEFASMLVTGKIHKRCGMNKTANNKQTDYGVDGSALFIKNNRRPLT